MAYAEQLKLKQSWIDSIFEEYGLAVKAKPVVHSPLEYEYRSKLTPHFRSAGARGLGAIGFQSVQNPPRIIDIDHCPIAMETINKTLPALRALEHERAVARQRGATLLLRASVVEARDRARIADMSSINLDGFREAQASARAMLAEDPVTARGEWQTELDKAKVPKTAFKAMLRADTRQGLRSLQAELQHRMAQVDDELRASIFSPTTVDGLTYGTVAHSNAVVTSRVGSTTFVSRAGDFFQNNPSILPALVGFVVSEARGTGAAEGGGDHEGTKTFVCVCVCVCVCECECVCE